MAEANIKTMVSIEAVLHRMFQKLVQEIADEYGVQVTTVDFDWLERHGATPIVHECRVQTKSNISWSSAGQKIDPEEKVPTCPYCKVLSNWAAPYCAVCGRVPPR